MSPEVILSVYWGNIGLFGGYIGRMENKMEAPTYKYHYSDMKEKRGLRSRVFTAARG